MIGCALFACRRHERSLEPVANRGKRRFIRRSVTESSLVTSSRRLDVSLSSPSRPFRTKLAPKDVDQQTAEPQMSVDARARATTMARVLDRIEPKRSNCTVPLQFAPIALKQHAPPPKKACHVLGPLAQLHVGTVGAVTGRGGLCPWKPLGFKETASPRRGVQLGDSWGSTKSSDGSSPSRAKAVGAQPHDLGCDTTSGPFRG